MASGSAPRAWSRYFRRLWRPFLTGAEKARIAAAVARARKSTTAEIRVQVVARIPHRDALAYAHRLFDRLGLDKTPDRGGVLILVSHLDHRFAVWGDDGVHARAGHPLWQRALAALSSHFAERRYAEGLEACVREVGAELAARFPASRA